jgi:hypothetical protein|tara:strand:- start:7829 stop:8089 length:261 start_codon:yes stop_codon:yes gene_type:complete
MDEKTEIAVAKSIHEWSAGRLKASQVHKNLKALGYKTNLRGIIAGTAPVHKIGDDEPIRYIVFKTGGLATKKYANPVTFVNNIKKK